MAQVPEVFSQKRIKSSWNGLDIFLGIS